MIENRCLVCLGDLHEGQSRYHPACCPAVFGSGQPPVFPYTQAEIDALATDAVRRHIAVPGVQPKLSLHLDRDSGEGSGRFTIVGLQGDFILKPPVPRYPEMPELEHLTLRMAHRMGISTAPCALLPMEDGRLAFVSRRMDRAQGKKLAMEDMGQILGKPTADKYRGSLESIGRAIKRFCANPGNDTLRFFELAVFCFLTGNSDMHLKNFSLLETPPEDIRLAPAYDLLPTALLLPEDTEETALTLQGKKRRLTAQDFRRFGIALELSERQVENALRRSRSHLPAALEIIDQGFCTAETSARYRHLVLERAARLGF